MMQYLETDAGYQPGVCNIGPAEIQRRRRIGYLGLAGTVVLGVLLLAIGAPDWMRLAIAAPLTVGISGLIQAQLRFCAGFAMSGLQNMGEIGDQVTIADDEARAADRRKALSIHAMSFAGGLLGGIAFALLPL